MIKRLSLLNGLAIVAVVCHHATHWGYMAMFWWTDRYRPVAVPNYDQFGSPPYYLMGGVRKLTAFAVPAFLFVSGFFVAYAARGNSGLNRRVVITRIRGLLVPYIIWSMVIFIGNALQGTTYTLVEYLRQLALGQVIGPYFYVPLLCQLYLLSPLIIPIAKTRGRQLLIFSALVLLSMTGLWYLMLFEEVVGVDMPVAERIISALPGCLFVWWIFFFVLGVVSGIHLQQLKQYLVRFKWGLLVTTVLAGALAVLESEVAFHLTGEDYWRSNNITIPSAIYAVTFVLCFLAFEVEKVSKPFSKALYQLGIASFGIYLLHTIALEFSARAMQKFVPWVLAATVLFLSVLIALAVGIPLLFMRGVAKSPVRRYYRYLFG